MLGIVVKPSRCVNETNKKMTSPPDIREMIFLPGG
jgi:hypothetical protein